MRKNSYERGKNNEKNCTMKTESPTKKGNVENKEKELRSLLIHF